MGRYVLLAQRRVSMSEQQRKQPIENLLDEFKLALKAPRTAETDKEPTLRVSLYENNPRLRVKTNMPMDKGNNNGYIDAAMNSHGFYGLMEMIREVARAREPVGYVIGVDGHPFIRGQRSKEKLPMGAICVERYEDGRITICVTGGKNRPLIEFDLMLDEYHHFRNKDGQPMDKRLAYKIGAVSWANMMEKIVAEALAITYAKPAWM